MTLKGEWMARLSRLLDEALVLDEAGRRQWLQNLPSKHQELAESLRAALFPQFAHGDSFSTLPKIIKGQDPPGAAGGLKEGARVGPYRVLSLLGLGGMGSVWLAERADGLFERQVALKLIHPSLKSRVMSERFTREREILASLNHPHIARLLDAGFTEDGQSYLALEYVAGLPLTAHCDERRLAIRERLKLFRQVLSAVQYAHAHLVIHRDLKPANILATEEGQVHLLDFGIAKLLTEGEAKETELTELGGRALTPDYAAPEQIAGAPVTTAADVYALGVMLYEILTGERPYRLKRDSRGALEEAILRAEPVTPSRVALSDAAAAARATTAKKLSSTLRGDLDTIAIKALKKSPAERYATANAFGEDIERFLRGDVVLAQRDSVAYRALKFARRHRIAIAVAGVLVLTLISGLATTVWQAKAAIAQSQRLQATKSFLIAVFNANSKEQDDPLKAQQTTARELLDRAAARLTSEKQPSVEETEEMLSILSGLYLDLGLDDKSADLRQRRVALLRQLYGPNDLRVAAGQVDYAKALYATERWQQALAPFEDAERILDQHGDASSFTRALQLEGMAEYLRGVDRNRARQYSNRAIALDRRAFPASEEFIEALRGGALIDSETGDRAGALSLLKEALAVQERSGALEIYLIRPLAEIAELQGVDLDYEGAERNFERGLEISLRINGALHVDTIQSRMRYGKFLRGSGRLSESRKMLTHAEDDAVTLLGNDETFHLPTVRDELAQTEYALGNFEGAADLYKRAIAAREMKRGGNRQHAMMLEHYAQLLTDLGKADESQRLLVRAIDYLEKSGVPIGSSDAPVLMSAALSSLGQHREALEVLDRYAEDRKLLTPTKKIELEVRRASVLTDMGELALAETLLRAQMLAISQLPHPQHLRLLEADARVRLGRLLMRRQAAQEACEMLESAMNTRVADLDARSPLVADSEVALAECLSEVGDTAKSRSLLLQAQAIDATHPELGTQFRGPLGDLNQRLAGTPNRPRPGSRTARAANTL